MDAVARRGQIDPNDTNRILRPRLDRKIVLRFYAFEAEPRVVMIGRVVCHTLDLELSAWCRLFGAPDRSGVKCHQIAVAIERGERARALVDNDLGDAGVPRSAARWLRQYACRRARNRRRD